MSFAPPSSFEPATVTVAGTVAVSNFPASQAVTGPLTDAQLAARLPLSVTGPLTDAQLRASVVPVGDGGGSLTVDGPLTDAQLRASAVPVNASGTAVPVTGPLTDAQLAARLPLSISGPVTGPLTDAQLAARLPFHTIVDSGSISVGNFPADQLVHFAAVQHVIVDSGAVTVSGTATVSGTVAVTQSTSPWVMDGSGVTQPVSVAALPLPSGAATEATLGAVKRAANDTAFAVGQEEVLSAS